MNRTCSVWIVAASIALAALRVCAAPNSAAGQQSMSQAQASPADRIDLDDVDRTEDPCTDFDAFTNDSWRARNPVPDGTQRWNRRAAARETNRRQLENLLEELAAKPNRPRGSVEQQLGDHYASCMDEEAIAAAGLTPLAPLLAELAAIESSADVQRMIRRLHELAVPAPFVLSGLFDYHDPDGVIVNIAAGGLGLADRDDYLKSGEPFATTRGKYRAHVASMLKHAGSSDETARRSSAAIVALETRLAESSLTAAQAADPAATAHKQTFAELAKLSPHIDWENYFAEAGLPRIAVNVAEPAFIERLDRELAATPATTWKAYLTWHLMRSAAPWLAKPFADESVAFKDEQLGGGEGATVRKPRALRCLESTEALLGEALGRVYAERYFPPAAKAKVQEMVRTLTAVLKDDLGRLTWMSEATRREALAKVEAYEVKVGYPEVWTDSSALVIQRDALWANVAAARRFGVETDRKRIGQRTSRTTWQLPPSSPAAYIDIQLNLMALPAGFLQPWAFDVTASDAVNYGAIGAGIAHDLTHAIDALGADFDAKGQPRNWWIESDREAFRRLGQCTVEQYDGYTIEPGVHLRGEQVLGEAVGDLAGVQLAYRALERSRRQNPVPVINGLSPEQQFFVAWGQLRGGAESLELQRQMVNGDSHPTARYRVNGPLSNVPEFQQAFNCAADSAMVRRPAERCAAW